MIQALTEQERYELNAWIAEHVDGAQWYDNAYLEGHDALRFGGASGSLSALRNKETGQVIKTVELYYTDHWMKAGPLFDQYPFTVYHMEDWYMVYDRDLGVRLSQGTSGPEAIAKAVKEFMLSRSASTTRLASPAVPLEQ